VSNKLLQVPELLRLRAFQGGSLQIRDSVDCAPESMLEDLSYVYFDCRIHLIAVELEEDAQVVNIWKRHLGGQQVDRHAHNEART
jgi:hypothetical protein